MLYNKDKNKRIDWIRTQVCRMELDAEQVNIRFMQPNNNISKERVRKSSTNVEWHLSSIRCFVCKSFSEFAYGLTCNTTLQSL